ncbi:AAA family ATPase [Geomobilimonas luticola]|uniref:MoxR family ATPase n=1 Tax=Geomobilimonas luticola TaxID=1114878 RepID=A0ABS5SE26_9BACT|nr:MoxR family ATPase [Geomobilimonas luticola]MBT0652892.1 MoxR family ATPase [Geomobilimonas luticola]
MNLPKRAEILTVMDTLAGSHLKGKDKAVRLSLIALLTGGHILLEDIPGLGKTTLALALANVLGLSFGRIQCTSDLLPSDITGLSVFNREESAFKFIRGPIFNSIVLVDEVNRAMPKTQSAMLEAMEERRVTVEGVTYPLAEPFLVIATQNPLEQVGTYPLPESQLDRFTIRTGIGYPPEELEKSIISYGSIRDDIRHIEPLVSAGDILAARQAVKEQVYLSDKVTDYIYAIVTATRNHPLLLSGISTRGGINIAEAARANAYLEGREYVVPEDVREVSVAVGSHRLICRPEQESVNKEELLSAILGSIPVPLV